MGIFSMNIMCTYNTQSLLPSNAICILCTKCTKTSQPEITAFTKRVVFVHTYMYMYKLRFKFQENLPFSGKYLVTILPCPVIISPVPVFRSLSPLNFSI